MDTNAPILVLGIIIDYYDETKIKNEIKFLKIKKIHKN
tara:strand:- start:592 stop:705 length:114 start_codon:yes stop_codon:yes gene_type:complete